MQPKTLVAEERERAEIEALQDRIKEHPAVRAWEDAGSHEIAHRFGTFMFEIMCGAKGGIQAETISTPLTPEEQKKLEEKGRYAVMSGRPCVGRWIGDLGYGGRARFVDANQTFATLEDAHVPLVQNDKRRAVVASFLAYKREYWKTFEGNVDPGLHLAAARVSIPAHVRRYLDVDGQQRGEEFDREDGSILLDLGTMPVTDVIMVGLRDDAGPSMLGGRYNSEHCIARGTIEGCDGSSLGIVALSEGRRLQTLALTAGGIQMYGLLDEDGNTEYGAHHEVGVNSLLKTIALPASSKSRREVKATHHGYGRDTEGNAIPTHEIVDPSTVGKKIGFSGTIIDAWPAILAVPKVSAFLADWTGRARRMNEAWEALKTSHAQLILKNCNF